MPPGGFLPNGQRAPGERTWTPTGQPASAQASAVTGYIKDGEFVPGTPAAAVPSADASADEPCDGVPDGRGGYPPEGKTKIGSVFGPAAADPAAAAADAAAGAYYEYDYYYTENESRRSKGGKSEGYEYYYTEEEGAAKVEGGEKDAGGAPSAASASIACR